MTNTSKITTDKINATRDGIVKDFNSIIKNNPSKYKKIIDALENKFP